MNKKSYYGAFGGQYVAESLMNTLKELDDAFEKYTKDEEFLKEVDYYLKQYVGRETPLYFASRLSEAYGTRKEMGVRTIFNILGPLANPSRAKNMVVGVYDAALTEKIALAMSRLGVERAFVVSGKDNICLLYTSDAADD